MLLHRKTTGYLGVRLTLRAEEFMAFRIMEVGRRSKDSKDSHCKIQWQGQSLNAVVTSTKPLRVGVDLQFEMGYDEILDLEVVANYSDDDSRISQLGENRFQVVGRVMN